MRTYPTNRQTAKQAKRGKGYCTCDCALVGHGQKCPVCGRRDGHRRLKKPAPIE